MIGNVVTKKYMSDNEKFADVFNYVLYDGRSVIRSEELIDCDPEELLATENKKGKFIIKDKTRDIKKGWILKKDNRAAYLMLGIENQTNIHYAMPVRNMLYDAVEYENQLKEYQNKHKVAGDLKGGELISGISKEDKLVPVITLVVYFGPNKWDGPRTLHEMFDIKDKKILEYINDYKLNLLEPAVIEDTEKFKSDFKYVVDFIKHSKDKGRLKELMEENNNYFSRVPYDTAMLIKYCADIDVRVKEEKEETDMCKAIDDMMEDAREEGRREKEKEMRKEYENEKKKIESAISIEMIINLNKKGLLSEENSAAELKMSLEEYRKCVETYK